MYPYNKWYILILSVKEMSLIIIRTFYPALLYLILTYCKLYRYLIIYFVIIRCSGLRLVRNCKRIKVKKVTLS